MSPGTGAFITAVSCTVFEQQAQLHVYVFAESTIASAANPLSIAAVGAYSRGYSSKLFCDSLVFSEHLVCGLPASHTPQLLLVKMVMMVLLLLLSFLQAAPMATSGLTRARAGMLLH
jgi:hypothetical protein